MLQVWTLRNAWRFTYKCKIRKTTDVLIILFVMVIKNLLQEYVILDFYKHFVKIIDYFIPTNTLSCWVLPFAKVLTASVFYFHEKSTISTYSCHPFNEQSEKKLTQYLKFTEQFNIQTCLPSSDFLMCFFMFKWNNSCGSCTTGTVAIQR